MTFVFIVDELVMHLELDVSIIFLAFSTSRLNMAINRKIITARRSERLNPRREINDRFDAELNVEYHKYHRC